MSDSCNKSPSFASSLTILMWSRSYPTLFRRWSSRPRETVAGCSSLSVGGMKRLMCAQDSSSVLVGGCFSCFTGWEMGPMGRLCWCGRAIVQRGGCVEWESFSAVLELMRSKEIHHRHLMACWHRSGRVRWVYVRTCGCPYVWHSK